MSICTIDDLKQIMRDTLGDDESIDLTGNILDVPLVDLGYDSLARLELAARLRQHYGVVVPDEDIDTLVTPRDTLACVNDLAEGGGGVTNAGHTDNSIVIAASLGRVWRMANDVPSWPQLFSEYADAEILRRDGETILFRLIMHPDENGKIWSWTSERTPDVKTHTVSARRIDAGPFEYMHIKWTFEEVEDGVLMRWVQDFQMKATAPVDNAGMTQRINTNTPREMARIKEIIERAKAATARLASAEVQA